MNFLKLLFISIGILSGIVLGIIFIFSQSEDQGVFSNKVGNFMPGSFDAVKNKIIALFSILFVVSMLFIATIEYRSIKPKSGSGNFKDGLEKDFNLSVKSDKNNEKDYN